MTALFRTFRRLALVVALTGIGAMPSAGLSAAGMVIAMRKAY